MVRFSVAGDSSAYPENVEFSMSGAFEIDAEFLNDYLRDFEELIKG